MKENDMREKLVYFRKAVNMVRFAGSDSKV